MYIFLVMLDRSTYYKKWFKIGTWTCNGKWDRPPCYLRIFNLVVIPVILTSIKRFYNFWADQRFRFFRPVMIWLCPLKFLFQEKIAFCSEKAPPFPLWYCLLLVYFIKMSKEIVNLIELIHLHNCAFLIPTHSSGNATLVWNPQYLQWRN